MEIGQIRKVDIDHEMQQSYLDYAMSVIIARALPDARDGLKPVQRRILYAMYDMGLRPDSAYKKSARIVGEVLGKYHPHGDMAVYEAMARMGQDFSMRNMLVDGQGNFGSVDGDPPAAMRYTEARLTSFAIEILNQIDRNTVNFGRNFDGSLEEPDVLPAAVPNLLVNGATGIAVGMATSIPPHNLAEVIDALIFMLEGWDKLDDVSITDLMRFVKGPDFPTGGIILQEHGSNELVSAYATGKGRLTVRGRVHLEDMERGKRRIIINELPYQVNKSALIERIAELVREGNLDGISDLRDESDRQGMRIVIELSKAAVENDLLRELYKRTPLQSTISINLLALVENEPHLLNLKQALRVYLEHRMEVVRRRTEFDLDRARARAHILEGLRIAIKFLDEVIALIRAAPDAEAAHDRLMKKFKLSDVQARAILEMPLRRLAALERKKIEDEYKGLIALIKELEALLKSPVKMRQVIEQELQAMKAAYADRRRTQIVSLKEGEAAVDRLTATDVTPAQVVWVGVTSDGLISRTNNDELPRVSGREAPRFLLRADTHQTLYLVDQDGKAAAIALHGLPEVEKFSDGVPVHKVSPLDENTALAGIFSAPMQRDKENERFVVGVTQNGMVKKTSVTDLPGPSTQQFTLVKVDGEDLLGWVFLTKGEDDILLLTARGMAIRFNEKDVRPMGLVAGGVSGIKLAPNDVVCAAQAVQPGAETLLLASNGQGWRIPLEDFPQQGRYGQGVIACKLPARTDLVGLLVGKKTTSGWIHLQVLAAKQVRLDEIPLGKRGGAGKELVPVKAGDAALALSTAFDSLEFWEGKAAAVKSRPAPKPRSVEQPALLDVSEEGEKKAPVKASQRTPSKAAPARPAGKPAPKSAEKSPAKAAVKKAGSEKKSVATQSKPQTKPPTKAGPVEKTPGKSTASKPAKSGATPASPMKPDEKSKPAEPAGSKKPKKPAAK
ncbi:DNA gyrase subunit A [Longilinea arvoryzae]|uniref:DNA topoisomerase (ATP-hydrolyzing) n=1 Tax=Longilinea arvoryzae TaxID=360412 RepID=A0A0S7BL60_9CHLR|nr:DNA topoisomerase (ATP-hydrolyzing) [Longilinea arvoryzae]GAP14426.1 DNA gyrase subunit A [Longilinea arvoryzae]